MREAIKFQYTNWSDPLDDEARFEAVKKLVADHQFDCPIDDTIELLASRFDVFRYVDDGTLFSVREQLFNVDSCQIALR